MKLYIGSPPEGFTADEVRRGLTWVYTDITCPHCGREQPVAMTGYLGGSCVRCGKLTGTPPAPGEAKLAKPSED